MKLYAQTIKSEFELTRELAQAHGGEAIFTIEKTGEGFEITRSGKNLEKEEHIIEDVDVSIYYKRTGPDGERELSDGGILSMSFSQADGSIIGPDMLDYIIISNGSKNYKFIIKQNTGSIYYDYEVDMREFEGNVENNSVIPVDLPVLVSQSTLKYTGQSLQPDLKYNARYVKIGGIYRAINVGTYTITFTLKDPYSTKWSDGKTDMKTLVWKIEN